MELINIRDAGGKLRKSIAMLRVPQIGEFVRIGTGWQQVDAVWHSCSGSEPVVTVSLIKAPANATGLEDGAGLVDPD